MGSHIVAVTSCVAIVASAVAAPTPAPEIKPAKEVIANAPRPEYPESANKHGIGGRGVFVQYIDTNSGAVTSVSVKQSTGHELLDRCAVDALRRWKYKTPTKIKQVSIPITFVPYGRHVTM